MPFRILTNEFRQAVQDSTTSATETKRRKIIKHSPPGNDSSLEKKYIAEGQNILNHIRSLTKMLASIRAAYLNIDARVTPLSRQGSRTIDLNDASSSWTNAKYLSNEDRDQIDMQARDILTRCSSRIKDMETVEKRRAGLAPSKGNALTRFLPSRLRQDEATLSSDVIAAHHASITWYLSRRLTEASQTQKELQEERIKRQIERSRSLGAAPDVLRIPPSQPIPRTPNTPAFAGPGGWLENTIGVAIGAPSPATPDPQRRFPVYTPSEASLVSDDEDDDIELSSSQIMQFEAENAHILKNVQDTLESVQQAESRLMDISALQAELMQRLMHQTELTNQLYEDALSTTVTVEKGNEQLKEAKRRAKDSRLFILVFLFGASLSLLFLHYY